MSETQRKLIKTVVYSKVNNENITKVPNVYWTKEKDAMDYLTKRIIKAVDCCDLPYRESCSMCISDDDLEFLLSNEGFFERDISILSQDYSNTAGHTNIYGKLNYKLQIVNDEFVPFKEMVKYDSLMQTYDLTFEGFITDNYSTCSKEFDNIDSMYTNSTADIKIWWNVSETGKLWEKNVVEQLSEKIGEEILNSLTPPQNIAINQCHGTKRAVKPTQLEYSDCFPYTKSEGRLAHYLIQNFYMGLYGGIHDVEAEYFIPGASTNVPFQNGYADIVNLTSREIFEIKTVNSMLDGVNDVEIYVRVANNTCDISKGLFRRGTSYPPKVDVIPWVVPNIKFTSYLDSRAPANKMGVITYELSDKKKRNNKVPAPAPIRVPITEDYWKKVYDLLKAVVQSPVNLQQQVVLDFIENNNKEVINKILHRCMLIELGLVVVTAAFEGTIAGETIPAMIAAGLVIMVIINYDV